MESIEKARLAESLVLSLRENGIDSSIFGGCAFEINSLWIEIFGFSRSINDIDIVVSNNMLIPALEHIENYFGCQYDRSHPYVFEGRKTSILLKEVSIDLFSNPLYLNQCIHLRSHLNASVFTIDFTDLFMTKVQRVHVKDKDLLDIISLLCSERPSSETNHTSIDPHRVAVMCCSCWGFYNNLLCNIRKARARIEKMQLEPEKLARFESCANSIERCAINMPKSTMWLLRDWVGERVRWYQPTE